MAIDQELETLSDDEYDTRLQTMVVGEESFEATSLLPCGAPIEDWLDLSI